MTTYTIKSGDTLSAIAAKNGTTVAALMAANPSIKNANQIQAGASLTIPSASSGVTTTGLPPAQFTNTPQSSSTTSSSAPAGGSSGGYKIQSGDTLSSIAAKNGTTVAAIMAANPSITNANNIQAGASLTLPTGSQSNSGSTGSTTSSSSTSSSSSTGNTNTTDPNTPPSAINTGNPTLDAAYASAAGYTTSAVASGATINPALQITPDLVSQFISEATTQMDPYYQQQMGQEMDSINASLANVVTQYQASQGQDIQDFQAGLNTERNASGGAGVALSGGRGLAEQNLVNTANRTLAGLDSSTALNAGNIIRQGASALGTSSTALGAGMNAINLPSFTSLNANLGGAYGGSSTGSNLNLGYNPSNFGLGTIPAAYGGAVTGAANQFMSSYLKSAANNSAGTSVASNTNAPSFLDLNGTPTLS